MNSQNLFRIVRVAGIDVFAHWSVLILLGMIIVHIAPEYALLFSSWGYVFAAATALGMLFSILFHEISHLLVAKFVYKHKVQSIVFFLVGGGTHIGEEENTGEQQLLRGEWVFSLAGPAASFLFAGALQVAAPLAVQVHIGLGVMFYYLAILNVTIGAFNMLPIFPMDGGRILRAFLVRVTGNFVLSTHISVWLGRVMMAGGLIVAILTLPFFSFLWLAAAAWIVWKEASREEKSLLDIHTQGGSS
jgi:Zn-dependent protease